MDTLSNSVQTIRILIMKIFNQFSSWIQYPVGGNFIDQVNRFTHKHLSMDSKQSIIHVITKRILLLFVLSIASVLFMMFYLFDKSSTLSVFDPIDLQYGNKTSLYRDSREPVIFSKAEYYNQTRNRSENVICFLVASYNGDVRLSFNPYPRLRQKVLQLDERFSDNSATDVIIFHTGYPFREDILPIIENSTRQVEFINVDHIFYKFSPGFHPHITDPTWSVKGKWNYHHMCYFWFKQVFELKVIQQYRYMMRLDDDSQILGNWTNVFELMVKHKALYLANFRVADYEYILPGLTIIKNVTAAFIAQYNITSRNPEMLADIFNRTIEVPNYWNNVEVVDLSFMQRKEVLDFTRAIDESRGIFLYRWGDAPLRYVTLALFANATQVLHREAFGLAYCHPC